MTKGPALLSNENYVIYIDVQKGWPFYTLFNNFYRASYASTVLAVIVCLSVRLSVTSPSCTKTAKSSITVRTSYDSPGTLVFRCQKSWRNSNDITPMGAPNRGGVGSHRRFSTNISLYLRNGAR